MKQVLNKYDIDKSLETENAKEKYIGKIFQSKNSGKFKVLGVHSKIEKYKLIFVIEFLDTKNQALTTCSAISTTEIRDVFAKAVFDAGYIGNYKGSVKNNSYYMLWQMMLKRCLVEKYKRLRKTYLDCTVSDDWLCFDIFQKDCQELIGYKEKEVYTAVNFEIDKDVLFHGNKHYSKENCIWLPNKLNSFFTNINRINTKNATGFEGVNQTEYNKYVTKISVNGKSKYIGVSKTPLEAYLKYCKAKSEVLEMYLTDDFPFLDERIKKALRNKLLRQQEERIGSKLLINQSDPMDDVDRIVSNGKKFDIV